MLLYGNEKYQGHIAWQSKRQRSCYGMAMKNVKVMLLYDNEKHQGHVIVQQSEMSRSSYCMAMKT